MLPLGAILKHYKNNYHIYADDTQIDDSFEINSSDDFLGSVSDLFADIRLWMIRNKLKIYDDKTEVLITSPFVKLTRDIQISIGQDQIAPSSFCKSLGVMFNQHLSIKHDSDPMDPQAKSICH